MAGVQEEGGQGADLVEVQGGAFAAAALMAVAGIRMHRMYSDT